MAKVRNIEKEDLGAATMSLKLKDYKLMAEIGQGIALPAEKKYRVKMIVGGHEIITDKSKTFHKKNYNRYN